MVSGEGTSTFENCLFQNNIACESQGRQLEPETAVTGRTESRQRSFHIGASTFENCLFQNNIACESQGGQGQLSQRGGRQAETAVTGEPKAAVTGGRKEAGNSCHSCHEDL